MSCEHGRQRGKCSDCDLIEADAEVAALRALLTELTAFVEKVRDQGAPCGCNNCWSCAAAAVLGAGVPSENREDET